MFTKQQTTNVSGVHVVHSQTGDRALRAAESIQRQGAGVHVSCVSQVNLTLVLKFKFSKLT